MKLKDNSGFTLIELLAVITIMGVLMMIAIPGINGIIQNVRKNVYVNDAKAFKSEVQKAVMEQTWSKLTDPDTTYYIHINNVSDKKPSPSPWAEWKDAYVVVTIGEKGEFNFHWLSVDDAGWKIDLKVADKLVKSDVYKSNVKRVNYREALGETTKVVVLDANGVWREFEPHLELTGEEADKCYSYERLEDNTITITWYNDQCGKDITLPARIDGYLVTAIHSYAFNNKGLTSIFIPDTIKTIGSNAFSNNNLTQLYVPESVKTINSSAFSNNKLTNLTLEEGLKTMGASCFKNNRLTVALVPGTVTSLGACSYCDNPIPNPSFLYKQNGDLIDYSSIRGYIGDLTEFSGKNFVIPSEVNGVQLKTIESGAFQSMSLSGWNVVIPSTVTYIGGNAFWGAGIGSVNLPEGLKYIGGSAFYSNNLTSIYIPNSVTYIGNIAFARNYITDPNRIFIYKRTESGIDYSTLIGYCGRNRTDVVIPGEKNGVALKSIEGAFQYSNLKGTVTIPSSVTSITTSSFMLNELTDVINGPDDNDGLPIVYARRSDGSYDKSTILIYAAHGGRHVDIPSHVVNIGSQAFYYSYIKSVTIPEGVKTIGSQAFALCKLEGTVTIPSTVETIGSKAFEKNISWTDHNAGLVKIVNKTGRTFNWKDITGGPTAANFETGTVRNWYGNIEVTRD
ncbi:MAG: leucine-rich repeat protein [Bacilli bacterium]|nr:leucine-rich repeat protein [Bacilli bacterium]